MINIYNIANIVFYALLGISFILLLPRIVMCFMGCGKAKQFKDAKKEHKYAILVPARNESKVIRQILDSIKNQTYNKDKLETFVIVESLDDPTCEICKEYENVQVFCRQHLENKGKGYALDECFSYILNNQKGMKEEDKFEAFFIMDADNVMAKDYVYEMNKVFDAGFDVGTGYRANKNFNDSWVSACSGLYFNFLSTFKNKPKAKLGLGVQVTGTGFYVSRKIIEQLDGWKFNTLTEDYEFSLCAVLHNYSSSYNEKAVFYDEQPSSLKVSWKQRVRWCKGFMQANKIFRKSLFKKRIDTSGKRKYDLVENATSLAPIVFSLVSVALYAVVNLVLFIISVITHNPLWYYPFISFVGVLLGFYLLMVLYSGFIVIVERKRLNAKPLNAFVACLTNPWFMILYAPIFFQALFTKNVEWTPIIHTSIIDVESVGEEEKQVKI